MLEHHTLSPDEELQRLKNFGKYYIRYFAKGASSYKYIIPITDFTDTLGNITRSVRGARAHTKKVWAELCINRRFGADIIEEAALVYGGHPKGDWNSVDGGEVMEKILPDGQVIRLWDPEPDPESMPATLVPEPEAISMGGLVPVEEEPRGFFSPALPNPKEDVTGPDPNAQPEPKPKKKIGPKSKKEIAP